MNDVKIVERLPPYCYEIPYNLDFPRLLDSVYVLLDRLNVDLNSISQKNFKQLNLTHLPHLTGSDRWAKHNRSHFDVRSEGVDEKNFTEHLAEAQDLYIGKIIHDVYNQHNGKFQGRASLIWIGAKQKYNFHRDLHTPNRYHVPLITNEECYFLFKKEGVIHRLHMPVGNVWYLDPISIEHTFINNSDVPRLHLLLTSGY